MPTADGKITAARLAERDQILVRRTTAAGVVIPSTTKTGPDTVAARVLGVRKFTQSGSGHFGTVGARSRLVVDTDAGAATVPAHQTFWLASARKRAATPTPQEDTAMTTTVRKGTGRPTATAKRERAAQRAPKATATATGTLPEDFKGRTKVMRLIDGAAEHGWTATLSEMDPKTGAATVTCARGEDSIRSEFIDGKSAGYSFHTLPGGKVRKLNNVSAVLHVMAGLSPPGHPIPAPAAPAAETPAPAAPTAARPARRSRKATPQPAAA